MKLQAISDKDNQVYCLRNGAEEKVHFDNIQVGDIVKIKAGMNIPVDGIVLRSSGVQSNESAMTGEPDELKKENMEVCLHKMEEKNAEYAYQKEAQKGIHDLPSPILLSGT